LTRECNDGRTILVLGPPTAADLAAVFGGPLRMTVEWDGDQARFIGADRSVFSHGPSPSDGWFVLRVFGADDADDYRTRDDLVAQLRALTPWTIEPDD
jgi:hypothetical protein